MALSGPGLELLDGHDRPGSRPRGAQSVRVDPPFEDEPEPSLPDEILGSEVLGGILELAQAEGFESTGDGRAGSRILERTVSRT